MKLPSLSPFRLLLAALLFVPSLLSAQDVTSPDGKMLLSFSLTDGGVPTYSVSFGGKAVVLPSTLGIQLAKGGEDLTADLPYRAPPPAPSTRHGHPSGARSQPYATTTMSWK